ncbi:hypothetical protein PPERSA_00489 [Pseudocohnilembus persalinus]|uniref:Uncharacterized protein n=1 Tax=Pseudocohnilembus persalinus TaxID=266149 RepID=A0A0V0QI86_PSEPJ|nr:hypothetical protein PPERSA_00489 [Pseudocohnilembus persalinus]|eukprot:KRX01867.1 hypothetical protein PPERSA_00489 [Pseudocohnilembus persalinus]
MKEKDEILNSQGLDIQTNQEESFKNDYKIQSLKKLQQLANNQNIHTNQTSDLKQELQQYIQIKHKPIAKKKLWIQDTPQNIVSTYLKDLKFTHQFRNAMINYIDFVPNIKYPYFFTDNEQNEEIESQIQQKINQKFQNNANLEGIE